MRHAYLILAHEREDLLQRLVEALDDARNDIFVHIDSKAEFDGTSLRAIRSRIVLVEDRVDVRWADYSMVEAELRLLKLALITGAYGYFHLLSGADMPIVPQDEIHRACDANKDVEYVAFANHASQEEIRERALYHLFSRSFRSKSIAVRALRKAFLALQRMAGGRRVNVALKKGSQWWSITRGFAEYLVRHEREIKEMFNHTFCPDEMFAATMCWNTKFIDYAHNIDNEFEGNKRYIKWRNGELLPIEIGDVEDMKASGRWFARKFDKADAALLDEVKKLW